MSDQGEAAPRQLPVPAATAIPFLVGAGVAVAAGVYGRVHDPTGDSIANLFFSSTEYMKAWLATVAVALAVFQLVSAAWIYGKFPALGSAPRWLGDTHRLTGTLAFVATLPVAYHCLWSFGYQTTDARVWWHSLMGCLFYGAIAAKVLSVRNHSLPGWVLPVVGALTFTVLVVAWATSAIWLFSEIGVDV